MMNRNNSRVVTLILNFLRLNKKMNKARRMIIWINTLLRKNQKQMLAEKKRSNRRGITKIRIRGRQIWKN